jgi:hypothetical protein
MLNAMAVPAPELQLRNLKHQSLHAFPLPEGLRKRAQRSAQSCSAQAQGGTRAADKTTARHIEFEGWRADNALTESFMAPEVTKSKKPARDADQPTN